MQVRGGEVVEVLLESLLLHTTLQPGPLLLAPFLAKELQKGPELQEAGGQAGLLPERPRVRQGPQEPVLHLQELHLLPCRPPIFPPDNTS